MTQSDAQVEKIKNLAKRLKQFDLSKLKILTSLSDSELFPILNILVQNNNLKIKANIYYWNEQTCSAPKSSDVPILFSMHKREVVNLIIKCFCGDLTYNQTQLFVDLSANSITNFHTKIRDVLFKLQEKKLLEHFKEKPKFPGRRTIYGKKLFFYMYDGEIFVSPKELAHPNKKTVFHEKAEMNAIAVMYSRIARKAGHSAYSGCVSKRVAELIWKSREKTINYIKLENELKAILGFNC